MQLLLREWKFNITQYLSVTSDWYFKNNRLKYTAFRQLINYEVLLVNKNKIRSKTKIFAINFPLNEKQEQSNFAPLQGESKLYC